MVSVLLFLLSGVTNIQGVPKALSPQVLFSQYTTDLVDRNLTRIASRCRQAPTTTRTSMGADYVKSNREATTRAYLPSAAATQGETLRSKRRRIQGQEQRPKGGGTRGRCNATKMYDVGRYCMKISLNNIRSPLRKILTIH